MPSKSLELTCYRKSLIYTLHCENNVCKGDLYYLHLIVERKNYVGGLIVSSCEKPWT